MTWFQLSTVWLRQKRSGLLSPALLTRMSSRPWRARIAVRHALHRGRVADVQRLDFRLAAGLADRRRAALEHVGAPPRHHHRRARGRQLLRARQPHAAAGAGDPGHFSVQTSHRISPRWMICDKPRQASYASAWDKVTDCSRHTACNLDFARPADAPTNSRQAAPVANPLRGWSRHAAVLTLAVLAAFRSHAHTLEGRVVAVGDGDTITVLDVASAQHQVRLVGIDAPELGQPGGYRSKDSLSRLVLERDVRVEWIKTDQYGRFVGKVWVAPADCPRAAPRSTPDSRRSPWAAPGGSGASPATRRRKTADATNSPNRKREAGRPACGAAAIRCRRGSGARPRTSERRRAEERQRMEDRDERHALIRATARAFADDRIRPVASELDATERFPEEIYREMAGLGPVRHHRRRRARRRRARTACPTRS